MSADWATVASLATAGGTLVLAIATFAAVRSANRSARATERALLAGIRPVLVPSRMDDPYQKVASPTSGLAVLHGADIQPRREREERGHHDPESFRRLTRDTYIAPGDLGFWQAGLRDPSERLFDELRSSIESRHMITVDVLYGDHEGGQRTITRFSVTAAPRSDDWIVAATQHWNLDRSDPR